MSHRRAPPVRHNAPGMKGPRSRNITGELRQKRGDTLVGTIEDQYGVDLGVRSDMKLERLRRKLGEDEIEKLIKKGRK